MSIERATASVLLAMALAFAACEKKTATSAPSLAASSANALTAVRAGAAAPGHVVRVSLDEMPVEITLPASWNVLPEQSNERASLVAFGPDRESLVAAEQQPSAFLDGTRNGAAPPSSDAAAVAEALDRDDCKPPGACALLGQEALPRGGRLVTVRTPSSIHVEAWHPGPNGRTVRCAGEVATASAAAAGSKRWIDDPSAREQARATLAGICESVKALP